MKKKEVKLPKIDSHPTEISEPPVISHPKPIVKETANPTGKSNYIQTNKTERKHQPQEKGKEGKWNFDFDSFETQQKEQDLRRAELLKYVTDVQSKMLNDSIGKVVVEINERAERAFPKPPSQPQHQFIDDEKEKSGSKIDAEIDVIMKRLDNPFKVDENILQSVSNNNEPQTFLTSLSTSIASDDSINKSEKSKSETKTSLIDVGKFLSKYPDMPKEIADEYIKASRMDEMDPFEVITKENFSRDGVLKIRKLDLILFDKESKLMAASASASASVKKPKKGKIKKKKMRKMKMDDVLYFKKKLTPMPMQKPKSSHAVSCNKNKRKKARRPASARSSPKASHYKKKKKADFSASLDLSKRGKSARLKVIKEKIDFENITATPLEIPARFLEAEFNGPKFEPVEEDRRKLADIDNQLELIGSDMSSKSIIGQGKGIFVDEGISELKISEIERRLDKMRKMETKTFGNEININKREKKISEKEIEKLVKDAKKEQKKMLKKVDKSQVDQLLKSLRESEIEREKEREGKKT